MTKFAPVVLCEDEDLFSFVLAKGSPDSGAVFMWLSEHTNAERRGGSTVAPGKPAYSFEDRFFITNCPNVAFAFKMRWC